MVFGMSRSGTSLTTSMVASLLGGDAAVWRGHGAAYPTDSRNRLGYFERMDVVRLNYDTLRKIVGSGGWTRFAPDFASHPTALNFSAAPASERSRFQSSFEAHARPILRDMASQNAPFVLKDVRFSRTLPLWAPLLRERVHRLACVIPFRHPEEVERSSVTGGDRISLWRNYLLAALTSARSVCGAERTVLVEYDAWFDARKDAQLARLRAGLQCAGVPTVAKAPAVELVRASERHHRANASPPAAPSTLPPLAACLLRELQSGDALRWGGWDDARHGYRYTPCANAGGAPTTTSIRNRLSIFGRARR